jgi:hypothetical protein
MSRYARFCSSVALVLLVSVVPASPVTDGQPDAGSHPAVGFIMGTKGDPCFYLNQFEGRSGVLIAPDILLSTAEATSSIQDSIDTGFIDTAWVILDPQPFVPGAAEPDTFDCNKMIPISSIVTNPGAGINGGDVGVFILAATQSITPAALPTLDRLKKVKRSGLTVVTYGEVSDPSIEASLTQRSASATTDNPVHLALETHTVTLDPAVPPAPDPCIGFLNQGGAAFIGGTNELISLVRWSTPQTSCHATNNYQRLDVQSVRDFLDDFVTLP